MTEFTISGLAKALNAEFAGNPDLPVNRVCHPSQSGQPHTIAMAMGPAFVEQLKTSDAKAAILTTGTDWAAVGLEAAIFIGRPRYAMALATSLFSPDPVQNREVSALAHIDPSANLGANVHIGPFTIIGPGATIGDNATILGQCSIASCSSVGKNALIRSGARIGHDVTIGDNVIIHENAVIGADGFSFVTPEKGAVEEAREGSNSSVITKNTAYVRIHSLGAVTIGDDVEIGAGTTIDRGTLENTTIGNGTKIDNQVQVGHNVKIGTGCLLCAQVGIAGSASVGDRVVLGGKAGVADHVKIGSDVLVAAASAVASDVPSGNIMMGIPAQKREEAMNALMNIRRLPRVFDTLKKLDARTSVKKDS